MSTILFECEYQGLRYAGLGKAAAGESLTLYRVADGQLRAAFLAGGGPEAVAAAVTEGAETVTVTAGDPEVRFLPPLLPTAGDALLTGFMGTHRSKYADDPDPDKEFTPPNWLIKGFGSWVRMPDEPLAAAASTVALLEEPEVALVYVNDEDGTPRYAGYTFANDLNDIGYHLKNPWGWTPYSKLCETSMTPWLFLGEPPRTVTGQITIERDGAAAWKGDFSCGADALYHQVEDMVDHLFSYPVMRRPGLVSYVLLGADKASYHDGFRIADGDRVTIDVASHGVVLSNVIEYARRAEAA
ncbi:fumarylacetoacetate (FAA) hydrolase (plasmid) [Streptomyces sp. NBC_00868]|uniref:fumarylacetoacetate (FAA) hydrolase n=1 Tax=Streptomyces sp. NBC_00868 TaxID=2903683 RepID=UPI002F91ABB3|nr:fumarylacetoacetate (FAA) hydrolase [Streptomyces sp. NBC_00868]